MDFFKISTVIHEEATLSIPLFTFGEPSDKNRLFNSIFLYWAVFIMPQYIYGMAI